VLPVARAESAVNHQLTAGGYRDCDLKSRRLCFGHDSCSGTARTRCCAAENSPLGKPGAFLILIFSYVAINLSRPRSASSSDFHTAGLQPQFDLQSEDYVLGKHTYKSQYAQMYYARLMELAPLVKQRAQQLWGSVPGAKISDSARPKVLSLTYATL
jgi:hypothetical protein